MKKKVEYKNRYGDVITFEYKIPNKILMSGGEYFRFGRPNDYTEAYKSYKDDIDTGIEQAMSLEEFKKQIHMDRWDKTPVDWKNPLEKYLSLVKSDEYRVNMVDPSGGPYLKEGYDMNDFGFGSSKPMIIEQFMLIADGTVIILLK